MSEPIVAPAVPAESAPVKTFTQEEVDAVVGRRLAKAMKGMPSEEELAAFRSWQGTQQATQNTINTLTVERDTATGRVAALEAELAQLKQTSYIQSKGFSGEDAEFVLFRAAKMVNNETSFEQAVDQIAEERKSKPSFSWSAPVGEGTKKNNANDTMNALIRGAVK